MALKRLAGMDVELYANPLLPELARRTENVVSKCDGMVSYVGVARIVDKPQLYRTSERTSWILTPAENDPQVVGRNALRIPRRQYNSLTNLQRMGVDFDPIYLAHEVETARLPVRLGTADTWVPVATSDIGPLLGVPTEPLGLARQADQVGAVANGIRDIVVAAVPALLSVAALPVLALGAASALLGDLDPVVLGVISPRDTGHSGDPGAWFALASWDA